MGHSAGGHIAGLLCLNKSLLADVRSSLRACITLSPVLDVKHMEEHNDKEFNEKKTWLVFGKQPDYERFSPMSYLKSPDHAPLLVLIGEKDHDYLLEQTRLAGEKMKDDKAFSMAVIKGYEHSDMVMKINTSRDQVTPPITDFLRRLGI
ncbi:MAG: prolyl oligopeptidase family serine peptidase [Spirochaetia bacterium]|nr:prolyl oligopeptidase family serine peptidase [Spirochaetia bacterium]